VFLGLRVGELERIVGGGEPAVGLARPRTRIARDPPGPALDLGQKKSQGAKTRRSTSFTEPSRAMNSKSDQAR